MTKARLYIILIGTALGASVLLLLAGQGLSLVNLPGLILVLGGTFLASVIGHSMGPVLELLRRIPELFRTPTTEAFTDHKAFLQVANCYRRSDIRGAERASAGLRDPFLRQGAQLALDPHGSSELTRMLQWHIRRQKEEDAAEIRILRTMATFAPAFGMLGTLFGLISLLDELGTTGLEQIGVAMGFALLSTLYGLLAANLVFRPLSLKLEDRSRQRLNRMAFMLDALVMLYERQHPLMIDEYLESGASTVPSAAEPVPAEAPQLALQRG